MKQVVLVVAVALCLFALESSVFSEGDSSTPTQEYPTNFETLNGKSISVEDLAQGRWALGFIVYPGCPACEKMVEWFEQAAQAFPEIKFLFIVPKATSDLKTFVKMHAPGIQVLLDKGGALGAQLDVKRAPTVLFSISGVLLDRLNWPFTKGTLLRKLAESLTTEVELPDPKGLIGQPAPDFTASDLRANKVDLKDLPLPLLLVFLDPLSSSSWDTLSFLVNISGKVAIELLFSKNGFSSADRLRLVEFLDEAKGEVGVGLIDDPRIIEAYKVWQSPTYFLMDKRGVVRGVWEKGTDKEKLLEQICAVLGKKTE